MSFLVWFGFLSFSMVSISFLFYAQEQHMYCWDYPVSKVVIEFPCEAIRTWCLFMGLFSDCFLSSVLYSVLCCRWELVCLHFLCLLESILVSHIFLRNYPFYLGFQIYLLRAMQSMTLTILSCLPQSKKGDRKNGDRAVGVLTSAPNLIVEGREVCWLSVDRLEVSFLCVCSQIR